VSSVVAWVNAGSRHDAAHGSARLLQRLATRGTKKRNPDQLRADLQSLGGSLKTELYRENTVYQLNVLNKDLPKAVELLGDIVSNPNIGDDKTVDEEKTAHSQEVRKCVYNEMFEHLHECAFHDTALGRTVTGAENAASLSKGDVANYFASNFTGDRVAVAAVGGGVEHGPFKDLVEKHFGGLAAGSGAGPKVAPAIYAGSDKRIRYDSMDVSSISFCVCRPSAWI
jgi:processing peptidase subunit beta